jgi:hypothetical protein
MKILTILAMILALTPLFVQIYKINKDEQDRKSRMRFYDLHSEFLKECDKIQDNNVKLKAFEWLLEKLQERTTQPTNRVITEHFEDDFCEMWGEHIPEYKSKILSHRRNKKLKDLGI